MVENRFVGRRWGYFRGEGFRTNGQDIGDPETILFIRKKGMNHLEVTEGEESSFFYFIKMNSSPVSSVVRF
jgi:hypothetical protein